MNKKLKTQFLDGHLNKVYKNQIQILKDPFFLSKQNRPNHGQKLFYIVLDKHSL